jgi:hypothetical protein
MVLCVIITVLNDVLSDNHRDFHVLVANACQIVFGELCLLANGFAFPLLLIFFLMVSFKIPKVVDLSVRRGVRGCMWPTSVSVTRSGCCESTLQLLIRLRRRPHF